MIEKYIYRRDHYRSTSTEFPFPLPLTLTRPPQFLQDQFQADANLSQAIRQSLNAQGVQAEVIQLWLQSKPGYPNGETCTLFRCTFAHLFVLSH